MLSHFFKSRNMKAYALTAMLFGLGTATASVCLADNVVIPHVFAPGVPAKASEVNDNFNSVKTFFDNLSFNLTSTKSVAWNPPNPFPSSDNILMPIPFTTPGPGWVLSNVGGKATVMCNSYFNPVYYYSGQLSFVYEGVLFPIGVYYSSCSGSTATDAYNVATTVLLSVSSRGAHSVILK